MSRSTSWNGPLPAIRFKSRLTSGWPWSWNEREICRPPLLAWSRRSESIRRMSGVGKRSSHYAAALGDHELSTRVARELTTRRPGNATCWYVLARTLREPEQQNERLQALETAIRLEPRMLAAHDELATLFAERGELDKALKACEPNAFPEGQPVSLMARAAEIKARQGDFDTAIREMTEIIERDPRITAAWEQLLAWHQRLNPSAYWNSAPLCQYVSHFVRGLALLGPREGDYR